MWGIQMKILQISWLVSVCWLVSASALAATVPESVGDPLPKPAVAIEQPADMPVLSSRSVLVLNEVNGVPLMEKNADIETPIASISKLMTAMVVLDAHPDMSEQIKITDVDVDTLRHSSSRLMVGTVLTRSQLLHLALIASENRAAFALSRSYPGGREKFIQAMNLKAQALGMTHSSFEDPTGLSSHNHSTADDLAKMVKAAANYPLIHEITTTCEYDIRRTALVKVNQRHGKKHAHMAVWHKVVHEIAFHNTNQLVREHKWDISLSKTGYITEAGHCLVMQLKVANQHVIIVLLDSSGKYDRIADARRIHQWLQAHASTIKVASN